MFSDIYLENAGMKKYKPNEIAAICRFLYAANRSHFSYIFHTCIALHTSEQSVLRVILLAGLRQVLLRQKQREKCVVVHPPHVMPIITVRSKRKEEKHLHNYLCHKGSKSHFRFSKSCFDSFESPTYNSQKQPLTSYCLY